MTANTPMSATQWAAELFSDGPTPWSATDDYDQYTDINN